MQRTLSVVNLTAIRENALKVKSLAGKSKFFAVVKADAYGHGAERVARHIEDVADGFCVALIEEGISLRVAGITKQILVLTPPLDGYDVSRSRAYNLTVTVNSVGCARLACGTPCHIKVNTGMNRLGCNTGELPDVLRALPSESVEGVYSHLFAPQDEAASFNQLKIFERAVRLVKTFKHNACAHLSASGGILRGGKFLFDGVRCGILLYGYNPSGFDFGVTPALKVYARRTQTAEFIGGGAGYAYASKNYKRLSAYRCGYADGFKRTVALGENNLCMDAFVSERDDDMLCVFGNADDYARRCGTISYEALTDVTRRSEIIYER